MNKKQITTLVVVAVVFAAGGFFGGYKYGQSKTPARALGQFAQNASRTGAGGAGARRAGGGNNFVNGQVLSKDNNTLTVQVRALPGATGTANTAGSKIVVLSGNTQISKSATGTLDDITVGTNVTVTGTNNSDGSLTALTVQIRPQMPENQPGQNTPPAPAGQ